MNYEEEREEVDLFPVPEEEDDEEGEEEEEKSDRLKSRRGSAFAIPVRKGSISEVVEFDSGIINSGSLAVWANASRGAQPSTESTFDMYDDEEEREEDDEFPVPEEDDDDGEEEEEKSDRLKSRRGSAVPATVTRDRNYSISEVVEFDSGVVNSGSAKETGRKNSDVMKGESSPARRNSQNQSQPPPPVQQTTPKLRNYSISSVRSFDDTEMDA
eukprot:gene4757-5104_t